MQDKCSFATAGAFGMAALAGLLAATDPAAAQSYPTRSVRVVLPFPAGGGGDLIGRRVAQKLSAALGQPVVVDNRAGASGNIAAGREAAV